MFTQIYSMQSVEEALACIEAGADRIGLLVGEAGGKYPCAISAELAKEIFEKVGNRAKKILISVRESEEEVLQECTYFQPDILHLCAEFHGSLSFRRHLRERCPSVALMEAVGVCDESAIEDAVAKAKYADILILDTVSSATPGIGAVGLVHDWSIDKRIVEAVTIPVVLAGGLGPENVVEAIRFVRPAGVDSLTRTSIREDGVLVRKDIAKVKEFCEKAKSI